MNYVQEQLKSDIEILTKLTLKTSCRFPVDLESNTEELIRLVIIKHTR